MLLTDAGSCVTEWIEGPPSFRVGVTVGGEFGHEVEAEGVVVSTRMERRGAEG